MIVARFFRQEFAFDSQEWVARDLAELEIDTKTGLAVLHGPHADEVPLNRALVEPDTGERIEFCDHPEIWLRLMATIYSSADLSISIKARKIEVEKIEELRVESEEMNGSQQSEVAF